MTLTFMKTPHHTPEIPDYRMLIMRGEFMNKLFRDKAALVDELQYAVQMLCSPTGFNPKVTEKTVEAVAEIFERGYGVVGFEIGENQETNEPILLIGCPGDNAALSEDNKQTPNPGRLPEILYQLDYRADDRDKIIREFNMPSKHADAICAVLQCLEDEENAGKTVGNGNA